MAIGAIPAPVAYETKRGASAGGSGRRRQAVGLSEKIWSAVAPIWRARRAALSSPVATPRWIPTRGASSGQVSRLRGSGRDRMRAMQDGADQLADGGPDGADRRPPPPPGDLGRPRREPDAVTIALAVFFGALIVIVAIMLVAPMLAR